MGHRDRRRAIKSPGSATFSHGDRSELIGGIVLIGVGIAAGLI